MHKHKHRLVVFIPDEDDPEITYPAPLCVSMSRDEIIRDLEAKWFAIPPGRNGDRSAPVTDPDGFRTARELSVGNACSMRVADLQKEWDGAYWFKEPKIITFDEWFEEIIAEARHG